MKRLLPLLPLVLVGCHGADEGPSAEDTKKAQDVNALAKSSDGDWSKLSPDQQQMMIKEAGSEGTAKMVLQMKAHPPAPVAPGRPTHAGP